MCPGPAFLFKVLPRRVAQPRIGRDVDFDLGPASPLFLHGNISIDAPPFYEIMYAWICTPLFDRSIGGEPDPDRRSIEASYFLKENPWGKEGLTPMHLVDALLAFVTHHSGLAYGAVFLVSLGESLALVGLSMARRGNRDSGAH